MKQVTLDDLKAGLASRVRTPLLAYYEERLAEIHTSLESAPTDVVKGLQGQAQEVKRMIDIIKTVK